MSSITLDASQNADTINVTGVGGFVTVRGNNGDDVIDVDTDVIVIGTSWDAADAAAPENSSALAASTKAVLVIMFQFVAGPVGIHMLARAAHIDRVRMWKGTLSDDLREDLAGRR